MLPRGVISGLVRRYWLLGAALIVAGLAFMVACAWLTRVHWTLDFIAIFLKPALIGLAVMSLALGGMAWRRFSRARAGLAAAAFAALLGGLPMVSGSNVPLSAGQQAAAITIYQHNVLADNLDGTAIAAQVRELDPDIAVFIEASQFYGVGPDLDPLADTWPHEVRDAPRPARQARLRILSKYPVSEPFVLREQGYPALISARVETPNGPLTVIGTHFTRPWPFDWPKAQVEQLAGLQAHLSRAECPCVVVGDFNSPPWGRLARELRAEQGLHNIDLGWRRTWHAALPDALGIAIDLSFASEDLAFGDYRILPAAGSDHNAVMFEIAPAEPG